MLSYAMTLASHHWNVKTRYLSNKYIKLGSVWANFQCKPAVIFGFRCWVGPLLISVHRKTIVISYLGHFLRFHISYLRKNYTILPKHHIKCHICILHGTLLVSLNIQIYAVMRQGDRQVSNYRHIITTITTLISCTSSNHTLQVYSLVKSLVTIHYAFIAHDITARSHGY